MPLYEYYCPSCKTTLELLRPPSQADAPVNCPQCQETTPQRILSLFASSVKSNGDATAPVMAEMTGGGCCGGACGCHHH